MQTYTPVDKEKIIKLIDSRIEYFSGGESMKSLSECFSDEKVVNELKKLKKTILMTK